MDFSDLTTKEIIRYIKNEVVFFSDLPDHLRDNKEIVLEAFKIYGSALYHVSERLRDDKEVVFEAIKNDGTSLINASERLQNDKELLELLEKIRFNNNWKDNYQNWYHDRMEILANIREQELIEEKKLMEKSITPSNITSKKIKF